VKMSFSRVPSAACTSPCPSGWRRPARFDAQAAENAPEHVDVEPHGYFSTFGSGDSPATIVMHFAGQAVGSRSTPRTGGCRSPAS